MTKKTDLSLYFILDSGYLATLKKKWKDVLIPALKAGVTAVQLRCKDLNEKDFISLALKVKKITNKFRVPLIINDSVNVAIKAGADGLHLGKEDAAVSEARKLAGNKMLIGVSASTAAEAREAGRSGADYMGLGPVFKTKNKNTSPIPAAALKKIVKSSRLPVVAIGGIKEYNIKVLKKAGIKNFCFISGIADAKNTEKKTKKLKELIDDPA